MTNLPSNLYKQLYELLLLCGSFSSHEDLSAIFVDTRIAQWLDRLPQTNNVRSRIEQTIAFLLTVADDTHANGLILFLDVLKDRFSQKDYCYEALVTLLEKIRPIIKDLGTPIEFDNEPLIRQFYGHTYHVNAVAISPDNKWLVSGSGDTKAIVWDIKTGKPANLLRHNRWVGSVALSLNNHLATSDGNGQVRLWDIISHTELASVEAHQGPVRTIDFSSDGSWLATGGKDSHIHIWDVPNLQLRYTLTGHDSEVRRLAIHPDGYQLVSGDAEGNVFLWDLSNRSFECISQNKYQMIRSVTYSKSGQLFAATISSGEVLVWDIVNELVKWQAKAHQGHAIGVDFHPTKSLLATGGQDNLIKFWNAKTGELLNTIAGHEKTVTALVFSANGKWLASCSRDETVRLWNVENILKY